jgi:hypothetical protein
MVTGNILLVCILLAWSAGFGCAWCYFLATHLLRTRSEYYRDRLRRGFSVPEDWEEDR